jgi:hypothetical protein
MIIGISLNKEISCELICTHVQNLVTKFQQSNPDFSNSILVMEIKNVVDADQGGILNIEYRNHNSSPT